MPQDYKTVIEELLKNARKNQVEPPEDESINGQFRLHWYYKGYIEALKDLKWSVEGHFPLLKREYTADKP